MEMNVQAKATSCNPKDVVLVIVQRDAQQGLSLTGGLTVLDDSEGAMQQTLGYDQVHVPRSLTFWIMQSWGHLGD